MKSVKHGKATWEFVVADGKVDGTFTWEKGGKRASFSVAGEQKKETK